MQDNGFILNELSNMKNKTARRFKIRYIVLGLLGVMALAALVFMRFGGFGTGETVNPEEFFAYACLLYTSPSPRD